ncbi:MAG: hypothetical protein L3J32_08375, partial [Rhizobiaceae bacterium]|nr:hypothetical protein [Rhizobiaceae bacterium]
LVAMLRVIKGHGKIRADNAPGCPERFNWEYLKFLKWIYDYPKRGKPIALKLLKQAPSSVSVHHLKSRNSVDNFLRSL